MCYSASVICVSDEGIALIGSRPYRLPWLVEEQAALAEDIASKALLEHTGMDCPMTVYTSSDPNKEKLCWKLRTIGTYRRPSMGALLWYAGCPHTSGGQKPDPEVAIHRFDLLPRHVDRHAHEDLAYFHAFCAAHGMTEWPQPWPAYYLALSTTLRKGIRTLTQPKQKRRW
jgi:hypothetical protein